MLSDFNIVQISNGLYFYPGNRYQIHLNIWFVQVSCQIIKLVLRNNALTSLHGIENLKSLQGLDLSYNIISNFSEIEILADLPSLQNLWLEGNPICYARWFRAQVFSLFSHPDEVCYTYCCCLFWLFPLELID